MNGKARRGASSAADESLDRGPATTDQLRDEMPSRRTPGKTSAEDPAAAPFDTDDEAAGRPPAPAAVERAWKRHVLETRGEPATAGRVGRQRTALGVGVAAFLLLLAVAAVVLL